MAASFGGQLSMEGLEMSNEDIEFMMNQCDINVPIKDEYYKGLHIMSDFVRTGIVNEYGQE